MEFHRNPEFWVAVGFVILLVGLFKPVKKTFTGGLDARAAKIKADLDEAKRLRDEASELLAAYQAKQQAALSEAEAILRQAAMEAARGREQAALDLVASLKRREQHALDRIAQAEVQALGEVRGAAVDLAISVTARLLRSALDQKGAARLVDQAIAELPQKLH
jgi:F-type H+-transporting ATPase subunit b